MFSRLPVVFEDKPEFMMEYNKIHAMEHQDIASWINAIAQAKNLNITVSYYQLPIIDLKNRRSLEEFFEVNWKQHQLFYDFINVIGNAFTIPVFVFPKNYPSFVFDMDLNTFMKLEKDIHNMLWRGIDVLKSSL